MAVTKGKDSNKITPIANYSIISPDEILTRQAVDLTTSWSYAWYDNGGGTRRRGELFHVGGGNAYVSETAHINDYGTYTLIPDNDFYGMVHIWGAGGGGYNSGNDSSRGGGGGFTQGLVLFKANIPYALIVGQAGRYNQTIGVTTHGGGGGNGHTSHSGQGGGLSGVFYNSTHRGRANWEHNPPVTQSQALLIAGGGGGAGHHNTPSHHGAGGGGGGWIGNHAHNSSGGSQFGGGYWNSYSAQQFQAGHGLHGGRASQQNNWTGGGGGGWWGGGGGSHGGTNHYNGGSGGSGHHAMSESFGVMPNNSLSQFVVWANTEMAPSGHNAPWQYAANYKNPLAYRSINPTYGEYDGYYAGKGGRGNTETTGRSGALHGKIVITLVPELVVQNYFRFKQVSMPIATEWTKQDEYSKN